MARSYAVLTGVAWLFALPPMAVAQADEPPNPPTEPAVVLEEEPFGFSDPASGDEFSGVAESQSLWDQLNENLRINFDFVARADYSRERSEWGFLFAAGLDVHKVFSGKKGDLGTMVLQPYVVYRDNIYERFVSIDGNDAFIIELHDFYFNLTRFGRGRTNLKIGHFKVPFGLEEINDTHFTLHQFTPLFDAGIKFDWGVALNGSLPKFDYEVSLTTGTGADLSNQGNQTYLVAGRIGTPTERNAVLGLSALYGQVADTHGTHRVDEGGEDFRDIDGWVRRSRIGLDFTQILGQFEVKGQVSGGWDFEQAVINTLVEFDWLSTDEKLWAYLQIVMLWQDGHLGWDDDLETRLGFRWKFAKVWTVSAEWVHEFSTYAQVEGEEHLPDDFFAFQLRLTF